MIVKGFVIMERIASRLGIQVSELIRHAENVSKTPLTIEALKEWLCAGNHEDTIVLESPDYLSAIIGITEEGYNKEIQAIHVSRFVGKCSTMSKHCQTYR